MSVSICTQERSSSASSTRPERSNCRGTCPPNHNPFSTPSNPSCPISSSGASACTPGTGWPTPVANATSPLADQEGVRRRTLRPRLRTGGIGEPVPNGSQTRQPERQRTVTTGPRVTTRCHCVRESEECVGGRAAGSQSLGWAADPALFSGQLAVNSGQKEKPL